MLRVAICSPYSGDTKTNAAYARDAMAHSFDMGEAPFVSHLLYPLVLNDEVPKERDRATQAAAEWISVADVVTFYVDFGWSPGMIRELKIARLLDKRVSVRQLFSRTRVKEPLDVKELLTHLQAAGANLYYFGDERD